VAFVNDNEITEVTRRSIVDYLIASEASWCGRLGDDDFLARLYDLTKLPSYDSRYRNAAGDIHQHRINNFDWSEDWVFHDARFNLLHGPDGQFLKFLCETVHPIVRPETEAALKLVETYNAELRSDGWVITEVKQISGKPVFGFRKVSDRAVVFEEPTGWQKVDRQVQEMRSRLDSASNEEQYQAVGLLCREVLISTAQETFDATVHPSLDGVAPSDTDARRMLEAIFDAELKGSGNEEARGHAKAAVKLALALQHKRTADFRTAALCAEGTLSVVNLLAIIAGRRGRSFG
jgi:AbiJ N-terminal domain 3